MLFSNILERFVQRSAFTVRGRGVLENLLRPEKLDAGLGRVLKQLARRVELKRFCKQERGPKKPRSKRKSGAGSTPVSTARLLAVRKTAARSP